MVAVVVTAFSISSCAKVKWTPTWELAVDYRVYPLPANITTESGNYYTAYMPVCSIGPWAAELTIEGDAVWCGLQIENDRPTGTISRTVHGLNESNGSGICYLPFYYLANGAQEPRYAKIRVYRTDMDLEIEFDVKQNGR